MKTVKEYITELEQGKWADRLQEIYVDKALVEKQMLRYIEALRRFTEIFGEKQVTIFSAPGRSEIAGNHTDHQQGCVLATSLNLDAIAVVAPTDDNRVHLQSDDYPFLEISLDDLERREEEKESTAALIRGVAKGISDKGFETGGFQAYVTSEVLMGAGMSSSAAFETLIGTIFSGLYNGMEVSGVEIAKIGQYAENVYFGKPCGLMDQMACSVGGLVSIDFEDRQNPVIVPVASDFEAHSYSLCILDTKGSHVDLTPDYAAVPAEMKSVAKALGREVLRQVPEEEFYEHIPELRGKTSDRAVLRSMHFYREQKNVADAVQALQKADYDSFMKAINHSGDSSWKLLQNIYSPQNPLEQNLTVALALTERILDGEGAFRIHGGGFAGTILAFVPDGKTAEYKETMEKVYGKDSCHVLKVRPFGGIIVFD